MPTREHPVDACPGALQVHQAADGGLARIRVPGGRLRGAAFRTVLDAATSLGDGTVELTSRANLQVRGLAPGAEVELGARLAEAGLLPSTTHERVRNIIASPLAGPVVRELIGELDRALCARPGLAELPGRFLFALDLAWPDADVAALFEEPDVATILLAGRDSGTRVARSRVVSTMLAQAEDFLARRTDEWRMSELVGAEGGLHTPGLAEGHLQPPPPPLGRIDQADGLAAVGVAVPLGRLSPSQGAALAEHDLVITPWRGVVVPDLPPKRVAAVADSLRATGLLLDPDEPGVGVSACAGRGCAKALADVRADAAAMIAAGTTTPLPVHWSGCARRCGRPRGEAIDIVATEDGYTVTQEVR